MYVAFASSSRLILSISFALPKSKLATGNIPARSSSAKSVHSPSTISQMVTNDLTIWSSPPLVPSTGILAKAFSMKPAISP